MDEREMSHWLLRRKLQALAAEMRHWKAVSRREAPSRFWTHHSQIRAFVLIIHNFSNAIYRRTHETSLTVADTRAHAKDVLALFRIWEFLRTKLAQRLDDRYWQSLQLADEFAWACYKPAAAEIYKEPPLVFLNGGFSPFILPRNREFQAEFVPNELIHSDELIEAMSRLPFPVIGVPWYQVATAWELPVIAHEVGHSIEGDLRLTKHLRTRIVAAVLDGERQARWKGWASEIFADFYGCQAVGPAFVSNLAEFLAGTDGQADDRYPPTSVRLLLNLAFLGKEFANMDGAIPDPVAALWNRWAPLLVVPSEYALYATDVTAVADALRALDVKLPRFSAADYRAAYLLASKAFTETITSLHNVRAVAAAMRIGYDAVVDMDAKSRQQNLGRLKQLEDVLMRSAKPDIRAAVRAGDAASRRKAHLDRAKDWLE